MKKVLALLIIFLMVISTFSMFTPQTMGGASIPAAPTAYLTDFVQLTTNPQNDYDPSWSPDGSKVVWRAYDSSGWYRHMWDMNADGSNKRQLTFGTVIDEMPDYSPDGTKIVFVRYVRNIYTQDIMIMNADGSNVQQITSSGLGRQFPRWSNGGNKIVFYYGGAGTDIHEIHIMNSDGTDEIALVTDLPAASRGHWSPDDKYIVYDRLDGVWVVGTSPPYEKRQVYATTQGVYSSIFSPDGKYILFQMGGNLHLIDANGNYIAQLTSDGLVHSPHDWSPNGKYIAFSSRKPGNYDIWKARIVIGAPPVAFFDDFESYTVGTLPSPPWEFWFNTNGEITGATYVSPTKSLRLLGSTGWATEAIKRFTSSSAKIGCEVYAKAESIGAAYESVFVGFLKRTGPTTAPWYAVVTFQSDGKIHTREGPIQSYVTGVWYKIKIIFDRESNTYDVWIDDALKASSVKDIYSDPYAIEGFAVASGWAEVNCYFDNAKVFEAPPVAPEFTYDIHNIFDDYSDMRLLFEYIFQKGIPFGKIVDCIITVTVKDYRRVYSVSVNIDGRIYDAQQTTPGVYKVFYYLTRNDAAKVIWTIISAIIKLPLPGIAVTVPTPILKQIIIEDINFQKHYHAIDKRLPTIEDAILRLWYLQPHGQHILAASPVDILVIDSDGRKVGAIYENGVFIKEVREIPGAYYSGRDIVPEFIFIPSMEDVNVIVYGTLKGQYELILIREDKGTVTLSRSSEKVLIFQDEVHEYVATSMELNLSKKYVLTPTARFERVIGCPECDGQGTISKKESFQETCSECGGSGKVDKYRTVERKRTCPRCQGIGKIPNPDPWRMLIEPLIDCPECDGKGTIIEYEEEYVGQVTCPTCGGAGTVTKYKTVTETCKRCGGTGMLTQYYLTVSSDFGSPRGSGWYDSGTTANFKVDPIINLGNKTRLVFTSWSGDLSSNSASDSITMDSPKNVTANWRREYYLEVITSFGEPHGEGWYGEGSTASFSISPTRILTPFLIFKVFKGWFGDFLGTNPVGSITMDRPKSIIAYWDDDYTLLFIIPGVCVFVIGASIVWKRRRTRSLMKPKIQHIDL